MTRTDLGATVVETTIAVALVGVLASAVAPELRTWRARQAAFAAGTQLAAELEAARHAALSSRRAHAIVFRQRQDEIVRGLVVDGDGDGVRSADLISGVDFWRARSGSVEATHHGVSLGLADSVPPVPGGRRPASSLPMAPTGILTATPTGTLSTGTIYLCHVSGECFALRSYGPGGRVSGWQFGNGEWRRRW